MNGESYRFRESTGKSPKRQRTKDKTSSGPDADATK
jgi:hypothetical protein